MPDKTPAGTKRSRAAAPAKAKTTTTNKRRRTGAKDSTAGPAVSSEQRMQMIAEAAYYRAESEGFGGDPSAHWLEAEREVDARLAQG